MKEIANDPALTKPEVLALRRALYEAIDSVRTSIDSFMPPSVNLYTARDHKMHKKWHRRLHQYSALLKKLGGKPPGEIVSGFDLGEEE